MTNDIQGTLRLHWEGSWIETDMAELRRGLREAGGDICTAAEREVLEACEAMPDGTLRSLLRPDLCIAFAGSLRTLLETILASREKGP